MSLTDMCFADLQRRGERRDALVVENAAAAFQLAQDLPRNPGRLGQLGLGQAGEHAQIRQGAQRFRDVHKPFQRLAQSGRGHAQGVDNG